MLALIGIAMALRPLDLGLAEYLAASSVPLVVLILLERLVSGGYAAEGEPRSDPGSVESRASFATSVGVSFVIFGLTVAGVGAVATTPVWIAGWSVLLGLVSIARRSRQLFACAYALLCVGYLGTLGWPTWPETMATPWTGLVATAVPLAFALGMDRAMRSHARLDEQLPRVAEPLTYVVYAIGLFLVVRLAVEHLPGGWALVAPAALALALLSSAGRLGLAAATPAALALLSGLHVIAAVDLLAGPGPAGLLLPLLLLSAATLAGERIVGDEPSDERLAAAWSTVRSALVVLAAGTGMAAIYDSARLGIGWTTAGWSVLGVALMGAGFALRSARYRRVALFVLGASLLRVFFVDTRGLSDTGRTVAFFVLGVCLVGVAWLYNRFSDELKSWL